MGKNGVKAKNQLIDFIGLSKSHFCQKWLKTQIGEGIEPDDIDIEEIQRRIEEQYKKDKRRPFLVMRNGLLRM
jgi:hypothetical protein